MKESIYNLIPSKSQSLNRGCSYTSKYPHNISPTASTFVLSGSSYPGICNLGGDFQLHNGAHKMKKSWGTFGLPNGSYQENPKEFLKYKKNLKVLPPIKTFKLPHDVLKASCPKKEDKPLILHGDKNFIIENAVDNILMKPKQVLTENSENVFHKYYGEVPNYIKKYRKNKEKEMIYLLDKKKKQQMEEDAKQRILTENEVNELKEGLQKKWQLYNQKYAKMTHKRVFDNLVLLRK
jgi:hypothetical protein